MYSIGRMKLTLSEDKRSFTITGDVFPLNKSYVDHFQLIYEALDIAANSPDQYATDFAAMRDELMAQSNDWA